MLKYIVNPPPPEVFRILESACLSVCANVSSSCIFYGGTLESSTSHKDSL